MWVCFSFFFLIFLIKKKKDDGNSSYSFWNSGAVYILFLNQNGTVKNYQKISPTQGNLGFTLNSGDWFGFSVSSLGDLNQDSTPDIIVGSYFDGFFLIFFLIFFFLKKKKIEIPPK